MWATVCDLPLVTLVGSGHMLSILLASHESWKYKDLPWDRGWWRLCHILVAPSQNFSDWYEWLPFENLKDFHLEMHLNMF